MSLPVPHTFYCCDRFHPPGGLRGDPSFVMMVQQRYIGACPAAILMAGEQSPSPPSGSSTSLTRRNAPVSASTVVHMFENL
jgi:hypothetical protein